MMSEFLIAKERKEKENTTTTESMEKSLRLYKGNCHKGKKKEKKEKTITTSLRKGSLPPPKHSVGSEEATPNTYREKKEGGKFHP